MSTSTSRTPPQGPTSHYPAMVGEALTAITAHDVGNCLSVVMSYVELIAQGASVPPEDSHALRHAGKRALQIVEAAMRSKAGSTTPQFVDVGACANAVGAQARRLSSELRVEVVCSDEKLTAQCGAVEFERALLNLVMNAREATPAGGTILIKVKRIPREDGVWVEVVVTDDGPGFPATSPPQVPRASSKALHRGHGLRSVVMLVEATGGRVEMGTARSGGAKVRLLLPGSEDPDLSAKLNETLPRLDNRSVLLCLGDPKLNQALSHLIEKLGGSATLADTPGEALLAAESPQLYFDTFLCTSRGEWLAPSELAARFLRLQPQAEIWLRRDAEIALPSSNLYERIDEPLSPIRLVTDLAEGRPESCTRIAPKKSDLKKAR